MPRLLQPTHLTSPGFAEWLKTLPIPYGQLTPRGRRAAGELYGEMMRSQRAPATGTITVDAQAVETALVRR